ncbi:MAG: HAD hydrolase family protein [Bacilli bacterium]|nr:HAD hydrolase family protein [Bacilli bacterium]
MRFKAAFFDIDNTLFDYQTMRFVPSAIQTVKGFQKAGGKVFIASARCYDLIRSFGTFHLGIHWDGYIAFCGGLAVADHRIVKNETMPPSEMQKLIQVCKENGLGLEVLTPSARYLATPMNDFVRGYHDIYIDPLPPVRKYRGERANGALLYAPSKYDEVVGKACPSLIIHRFQQFGADVSTSEERSKGLGCQAILDYYGISKEEAIAFGDSEPDLSMGEACGTLVIMKNGNPLCHDKASFVADTAANDGIRKTFEHFGGIL